MIEYLKINNLALIESAEVEFDAGFNVISGESGAGKSILLSGIAILCGERCDRSIIRQGCDKCSLAMHISCGAAADELIAILGGDHARDRGIWAYYCYHHDIGIVLDKAYEIASRHRQGELKNPVTAFQKWLGRNFGRDAV